MFNFAGLGISSFTQFCLVLVLAHWLPQRSAGVFFEGFAAIKLLAAVATLGLDVTAVRYVAMFRATGDLGSAASSTRYSVRVAAIASTAIAVITILGAQVVAGWFDAPGLARVLQIMAVALPFVVVESVLIGASRGTGRMRSYVYVDQVLDGSLRLALVWIVLIMGADASGAALASTITSVVTFSAAILVTRGVLAAPSPSAALDKRALLRFSAFQWGTILAGTGTLWADTLLLGIWRPPGQVAAYAVATRTVALGLVFVLPIGIAFQPVIGRLHTLGDLPQLSKMYAFATRLATIFGCPPLILVALLASPILTLFYGHGYASAAAPLAILAAAQMVNVTTGPGGYMITMIGRTDVTFRINVLVVVINIALNIALIPAYGMVGAGLAWAAAVIISNILRVLQVWKHLHVQPFDRATVKALLVVGVFAVVAGGMAIVTSRYSPIAEICAVTAVAGLVLLVGSAVAGFIPGHGRRMRVRWAEP
jgi:O-antigen/teichoic acid export membrane protein